MNLKQALARARDSLASGGIEDAYLEGEILLRHVLGIDRARLYTELDRELAPSDEEALFQLVERRRRGEPSAYITGHREFYGLDFYVDARVLIPRPESELLVERAIHLVRSRKVTTIADIGTGCGAIAISLAVNLPDAEIYATDVSAAALEVARTNCRRHGVEGRVCLLEGDMLEILPGPVDLILANLPYVRQADMPRTCPVSFEPALSLDGGPDGLEKIGRLCCQAGDKLSTRGCLTLEVGQGQAEAVAAILHKVWPSVWIEVSPDLAGIGRVVSACLTPSGS